jgi:hypothetical protein
MQLLEFSTTTNIVRAFRKLQTPPSLISGHTQASWGRANFTLLDAASGQLYLGLSSPTKLPTTETIELISSAYSSLLAAYHAPCHSAIRNITLLTKFEMSALQRQVADATLWRSKEEEEATGRRGYPWPAGSFQKASEAFRNGWKAPVSRYPILLTADGPISSASDLQKLAQMESLPEVIETIQVDVYDTEIKKVTICHVDHDTLEGIEEKADVSHGIDTGIMVMLEGKGRYAWTVTALKAGVTLGDEDAEGSAIGKAKEEVAASSKLAEPESRLDGESEK